MGDEALNELPEEITGEQVAKALDALGIDPLSVYRVKLSPGEVFLATRLIPVDEEDEHGVVRRSFRSQHKVYTIPIPPVLPDDEK
jgi:hypothetical protein